MQKILNVGSAKQTIELGIEFANSLKAGDVVALYGDLGAGKTTFVQGIAKGLGIKNFVTSPSFVIINEYHFEMANKELSFIHIDLYRIETEEELTDLGLSDLFNDFSIVAIEWAEKAQKILPKNCKKVFLNFISDNEREVVFS